MYTKEQASKIRQQFWTTFGRYMKPVICANGTPANWLNYKTGIRHVYFKMDANQQQATIAVELHHPVDTERLLCYEQFESLRSLLHQTTGFEWQWESAVPDEHDQIISSINQRMDGVNVLNESDWPAIISFLKPRIISLDAFWDLVKDGF